MACWAQCCTEQDEHKAFPAEKLLSDEVVLPNTISSRHKAAAPSAEFMGTLNKTGSGMQAQPSHRKDADGKTIGFTVSLSLNRGQEAGFGLDFAEGNSLRVCHIFPKGPVPEYNATAAPDRRISVGDFIVGVEGAVFAEKDAQALLAALQKGGDLRLVGGGVAVRAVFEDGAVPAWNSHAVSEQQVRISDYITSVNGRSGTAKELVQAFGEADVVTFVVSRPAYL
eukprot:CAMPEP_0206458844 /NCGR_PEP_ID=MMETSP0324_2-20121206/23816_1 /ASSEMBLY_ACC=CAM_ASM_000836 /TAXON_ID=2866 /ORGANISM="Crypthecodinium cohnii, Strain Seligo" /LENGTH=224 /DNA_ID=CAMNT_0053930269 /DNA_START=51 /DNA_END=726 /DNA_ORIENTATION=-